MKADLVDRSTLVSAIIPTIGRPDSLTRLLYSLSIQTQPIDEVIIADASGSERTERIAHQAQCETDLRIIYVRCRFPNAVQQRERAVELSTGRYLLFLDDDVVPEPECVEQMLASFKIHSDVVAVTADFNNQSWPQPTRLWRLYLNRALGIPTNAWQGRVVGPLLRFGYNPTPTIPTTIGWLGTGNSLIRHSAFKQAGGFSKFFLHRSTINEDIDLSLKLNRIGRILFCPTARMSHEQAAEGRVSKRIAAEDDLFNRYYILTRTLNNHSIRAVGSVAIYFCVETASQLLGASRRLNFRGFPDRLIGHLSALWRIIVKAEFKAPFH